MDKKKLLITYTVLALVILILGYPVGQAYVKSYNTGNDLYNAGNYEEAILEYKKALNNFVMHDKQCQIRINYALSICNLVEINEKDQDSIKSAIEKYEEAINILTKEACDTHNEDALQLKLDIEAEIERLKNLQESQETSSEEKNEEEEEKQEKNKQVKDIKEKIQDLKQEAIKEQRNTEAQFKNYDYNYNPTGKNW